MKTQSVRMGLVGLCLMVFSSACSTPPATVPPTATMAPAPESPTMLSPTPASGTPLAYQQIAIEELGLSFQVPADWQRVATEWAWTPPGEKAQGMQAPIIGVHWARLAPAQEAEAVLLPGPSQVLESQPVEFAWGSGRRLRLEVYESIPEDGDDQAPIQSGETHVLIVVVSDQGRLAFDFFARAGSLDQLADIEAYLQHVLDSSYLAE